MNIVQKAICSCVLIATVLFIAPLNAARPEAEPNVLQAYVKEQTMVIFTDTELLSGGLKCAVSNRITEISSWGALSEENVLANTTILIDISTSMPRTIRGEVIATLEKLIENKSPNEAFKLVVFGNEIDVLQDFSADRYDLANAIEKVKFESDQSKIYDAVYSTIPPLASTDEKPTFYRAIAITDGIDDTVSGITKEELFIKLQNERFPVDVIAVSSKETIENKELSAIVRMSGGRYFSLNPSTDMATLALSLGISDYFFFTAQVPTDLLDGTTRQVDISDGVRNISIDVKFPVFNVPNTDTQAIAEAKEEDPAANSLVAPVVPESVDPPLTDETVAEKSITTLLGAHTIVIYAGAGVVLLIVIVIVITSRNKKQKIALPPEPGVSFGYADDGSNKKTEFVDNNDFADEQYTIKLSNANDPSQTWTLPIDGDLLIGRAEHCSVRLDDKSVSREQCKIAVQGTGLVVVHLGSTNKTHLNGSNVVDSFPLQSGDTLKLGREVLRIDYIQTLGSLQPQPEQQQNSNNGKTESIF